LFIAGEGIDADARQAQLYQRLAKSSGLDIDVQILTIRNATEIDSIFVDKSVQYDFVLGWYFLHKHISKFASVTKKPILGGGAIDARAGATVSLADPENMMSQLFLDNILAPHFFSGKQLSEIPIAGPRQFVERYRPSVYINSTRIEQFKLNVPRSLRQKAHILSD